MKLTPAEVAALVAAKTPAAKLAERAGVTIRTAYKLIAKHRAAKPAAVDLPKKFDRAKALTLAVNAAVHALSTDGGPAAVERLSKLAKAAKLLHGLAILERQAGVNESREDVREKLAALVERALRPIGPAPAGQARHDAPEPAPLPAAPPEAPREPEENPWLASIKGRSEWFGEAPTKAPAEPPTPTALMTTPIKPR